MVRGNRQIKKIRWAAAGLGWLLVMTAAARAGDEKPTVAVVVGPAASEIERYAGDELCGYLDKLFGIKARPAAAETPTADYLLVVGSPQTNPVVQRALGASHWPEVSEQGIVLKHARLDGQKALLVGGGSPRATLWAVYELVERWGVHYLLHGDVLPEQPGQFRLPEADIVLEPKFAVRQWRVVNDLADGPESWGMADYKPLLDQLAKLKFNRIFAGVYPWQPFVDLKQGAVERSEAFLWYGLHYPISDDMPGRKLFGQQTEFWNPDLPRGADYRTFVEAGQRLLHALFAHAKSRGFEVGMPVSITEFPRQFAPLLKDHRALYGNLNNLTVTPGPLQPVDDPDLWALSTRVVESTLDTYPEVDFIMPQVAEVPTWGEAYQKAWQELDAQHNLEARYPVQTLIEAARHRKGYHGGPEMAVQQIKSEIAGLYLIDQLFSRRKIIAGTRQPNAFLVFYSVAEELIPLLPEVLPKGSEVFDQIDYTPDRIVSRPEAFHLGDTRGLRHNQMLTLHDDNVGMLPASNTDSLALQADLMRKNGWAGFTTRYWLLGDHEPCVAFLVRRSWDDAATPDAVYRDQFDALCGPAASDDLLAMFHELETVTRGMNQHAMFMAAAVPSSSIELKHWEPQPLPAALVADREHYRRALALARAAQAKSSQRGKAYVEYWLGRLQFGVSYFDCAAASRQLAVAKAELAQAKQGGDASLIAAKRLAARRQAETAVQAARDALESLASVAGDQSDRGTVAVMAEYLYRPLKRELDALQ